MNLGIPSHNLDLLQSLLGRNIIQINRQLLKTDIELNDFEQKGYMNKYGESYEYRNVTNNSFWKIRTGKTIKAISILKSKYASDDNPSEFAIKIQLENNLEIYFEYLNGSKYESNFYSLQSGSDRKGRISF